MVWVTRAILRRILQVSARPGVSLRRCHSAPWRAARRPPSGKGLRLGKWRPGRGGGRYSQPTVTAPSAAAAGAGAGALPASGQQARRREQRGVSARVALLLGRNSRGAEYSLKARPAVVP